MDIQPRHRLRARQSFSVGVGGVWRSPAFAGVKTTRGREGAEQGTVGVGGILRLARAADENEPHVSGKLAPESLADVVKAL
jgi:hypothetical protein